MTANRKLAIRFDDREKFQSEAHREAYQEWQKRRQSSRSLYAPKSGPANVRIKGSRLGIVGTWELGQEGAQSCATLEEAQTLADEQETRTIESYGLHMYYSSSSKEEPAEGLVEEILKNKIWDDPELTAGFLEFETACDSLLLSLGVDISQDK